ncbi:MAG: DUF1292 domain-containing protein [Eubacteriales bacterium]|nr:DUF1292 domain-containing protein [Eubacteriales bacterium]
MEKITLLPGEGEEPVSFYVLDQATLRGVGYLLVADSEDGDGEALVLRDMAAPEESESVYEIVEDDEELSAVLSLFRDTLEELGIAIEE